MNQDMGKPLFWHVADHVKAIEGMIRADELQIAMRMCDEIPSWYLEPGTGRYPQELEQIKNHLYQRTYDLIEYANDWEEAACTREFGEAQWDNGYMFPRAEIISKIIKEYVEAGKTPWILDLGCSHGNLPLGLAKNKLSTKYCGIGLNSQIVEKVRSWVTSPKTQYVGWCDRPAPSNPTILFCSEVLEHSSREDDILHSAKKTGVDFDVIILSVPYCTLGGGLENYDRRLGHVRTYNSRQFAQLADRFFPGYKWEMTIAPSMVIVGKR